MTEHQERLEIPVLDRFGPEVRAAGLRLLATADGSSDLAAVVDEIIRRPDLPGILAFLARLGFDAVQQYHGQQPDRARGFVHNEQDIAQFALQLDQLEVEPEK